MKLKTGVKAGDGMWGMRDRTLKAGENSVNLTINIAQNSGESGTATAG